MVDMGQEGLETSHLRFYLGAPVFVLEGKEGLRLLQAPHEFGQAVAMVSVRPAQVPML